MIEVHFYQSVHEEATHLNDGCKPIWTIASTNQQLRKQYIAERHGKQKYEKTNTQDNI